MELRAAYGVLEVAVGASEEVVRDARKTLMKVWHPDRHANDPELEKRAQIKVAEVNTAFEAIRAAGFPAAVAEPKPIAAPSPPPVREAAPVPPVSTGTIELVPRRRVRWSVIVLLLAVVGAGAYLAVLKLGAQPAVAPVARDAATRVAVAAPDASAIDAEVTTAAPPIDAAAVALGDASPSYAPPQTAVTFGLGATREQVIAAQGKATEVDAEHWTYGASTVTFSKRGRVVGWWDHDDVLNVRLEPADPAIAAQAKAAGSYGMGASKDEVIGVQGTPNQIDATTDETWYYGKASSLVFNGTGRVTGYHNVNGELALP